MLWSITIPVALTNLNLVRTEYYESGKVLERTMRAWAASLYLLMDQPVPDVTLSMVTMIKKRISLSLLLISIPHTKRFEPKLPITSDH